jgi:hypothetical protein
MQTCIMPRTVYLSRSLEPTPAARNAGPVRPFEGAGDRVNTVKSWLSVLEATYQVFLSRPYHANVGNAS